MSVQRMTGNEPELLVYRNIRKPALLREAGLCLCEGAQAFRRLQTSRQEILSVIVTGDWYQRLKIGEEVPVWIAEKSRMEALTGRRLNQGVLAACRRPVHPDLSNLCRPGPFLFLALDRITHAVNLGSIARNCVAFGCNGLILSRGSVDPYSPRAIQASSGALFHIPVFEDLNLSETLKLMHSKFQTRILISDPEGTTLPEQADLRGNVCLVVGNEHEGISGTIRDLASGSVRIPMDPRIDSLNVASAVAVLLYAASQQRLM